MRKGRCPAVASWCSGPVLGCSSSSAPRVHEGLCKTRLGRWGPVRAPVSPRALLYVPGSCEEDRAGKMSFTKDDAKGELCEAGCIPVAERTAERFSREVPPALGAAGSRCLHPRYPAVGRCGDTEPSAADRRSRCEADGGSAAATSASSAHTMAPLTADRPPCGDAQG